MLLGYNKKRPTETNYKDFENKLIKGLEKLNLEGLSLMFYGSYVRGDYNPGRSDIDALMVFKNNVVINKKELNLVGKIVHNALKENNVPFQVSVTDIATMKDSRFNTYDESYKDYFCSEGKIVIGPDYRNEFNYELPTMNEQIPVKFNLRKSRINLLFAEHDKNEDYELFLKKFTKTLDSVSRASKQISYFIDGGLRKNRFSAQSSLKKLFPNINPEPLIRIKELYHDLYKLDEIYKNPDQIMPLWNDSLTFFEEMIKEYIKIKN
jgi:predicted nucleotidyltransferase